MATKKTRAEKMAEKVMRKVIETAFYKVAYGVTIPMMAIPKIFAAGEETYKACEKLGMPAEETAEIVGVRVKATVEEVAVSP